MSESFEFRILGPLEVLFRGVPRRVGGPKQRALLALLLLSANRVVSRDRLVAELFGDETPTPADTALRVRVSRLRTALRSDEGEARLLARAPGYVLRVEPDELDLSRFERLVRDGRELLATNENGRAAELFREALSLWRGRPLADLEFEPFVRIEIERLEELRLSAVEDWVDAELAVGRHSQLVPELEALTLEHPLRERFRSQLMLALYRSGRQAEGLEIYRRTQTLLREELGLEPGTALKELQRAMLAQEPSLEFRSPSPDGRTPSAEASDFCPFKGLAPYDRTDGSIFFGRERVVEELVALATETQLIALVGASGSGKSSLLRAGLLPALGDGSREVLMRPGSRPLAAIEQALGPGLPARGTHRDDTRMVIAVDQFEEVFTACRDEDERKAFIDRIVDAAWDPERRIVVALALRADFFARLAMYPELAQLVGPSHILLGPMTEREISRAIEGPCERVCLTVEPALVAALVRDVAGEPGGLPLLSTTLVELWQRRENGSLTFTAYEETGGVRGAVARLAERAYARLDGDEQRVARGMLLRLVAGGGDEAAVRRTVPVVELEAGEDTARARVLEVLTDARLVTSSATAVEIAHEALITHWPRLRRWLDEDARGRALHRHLIDAAAQWDERGRDQAELYRGARLASALEWVEDHADELNAREHAFLEQSRHLSTAKLEREQRTNRRLRRQRTLAFALVAVAIAAGAFAFVKRHDAQTAVTNADAQRLGAQALVEPSLDRSLLLARTGLALADTLQTRGYLLAALLRSPAAIAVMRGSGARLRDEALSPDGRTLAVRDDDGSTDFFDTRSHRVEGKPISGSSQIQFVGNITAPLHAVAFSPNGRTLAIGGTGGIAGTLELFDASTQRPRAIVHSLNQVIADVAFTPDGRQLATGEVVSGHDKPAKEVIVIRDGRTGSAERESKAISAGRLVGFALGGSRILVTRGRSPSLLLDARTLARVRTLPAANAAVVSQDGSAAALVRPDGSVATVDLLTGRSRTLAGRISSTGTAIAFAPDGALLATGAADGTVGLWTLAGGLRETLAAHSAAVQGIAFSPDGRTVYSAAEDGTAIALDAGGDRRLGRLLPFAPASVGSATASAVSPDGSLAAVSPGHDRVELMSPQTRRLVTVLRGPFGQAYEMRFSPDGTLLAAGGSRDVVVWAVATRRVTHRFASADAVAFSPDSSTLAAGSGRRGVTLYDLGTGDEKLTLPTRAGIDSVDYSRNGNLVAAGLDGSATVWALPRTLPFARLGGQSGDYVARFAPDGKLLAVGDSTGAVVLWDVAAGTRVGTPLSGHSGGVVGLAWSRDGKALVTASGDGKLRLWDVSRHELVGEPLPGSSNGSSVEFFPDGRHALGMFRSGTAIIWSVDPAAWAARACSVANGNLTRAEWKRFLPGVPYRTICPRM